MADAWATALEDLGSSSSSSIARPEECASVAADDSLAGDRTGLIEGCITTTIYYYYYY
jgi:hypothetical protein